MTSLPWPTRYALPGTVCFLGVLLLATSFFYVGTFAILFAMAWMLFRFALNRRLEKLVKVIDGLASGDPARIPHLDARDELAAVSEAFRQMSEKVFASNAQLREANERMKQEITERKFIEEALRNSERRFRSVWENSLEPLRLSDSRGVVIAANSAYCRLMEKSIEEVLEHPYTEVYEAEKAVDRLSQYVTRFQERNFERNQTKRIALHSGRTLDIEVSYSFIDMEGDRPLLLGVFRDVTHQLAVVEKLNQAKEFNENLIKTATMMIVGVDAENRITIFNEAAEQTSGFTKAETQGKKISSLIRGAEAHMQTTGDKNPAARKFEARIITKSNEERLISWQTNQLLENGQYAGTICFGIDVTEAKKEEEHRLALERKLLDAQKLESLGVLAGGIAHDFNNLLAAILGNTNLAQMQLPESEAKLGGYLKSIEKASMRAADLCKQMLAYSGKGRFAMRVLDVNEVVRETLELLEVSITKKAALRVELRHGVPGVYADATQIRQVIMNLVINASEAMGENSGLIRVRTGVVRADANYFSDAYVTSELPPGEYVYAEVSDTGCGMSAETQKRIFDPFFTTKFTGRGLGLAAVLGIVRGHKGALKLASEPGKGSSFKFLLPMATSPTEIPEVLNGESRKLEGEGTILVVDDDPTVRAVITRMVESFGFEVLQAVDGRHGVEVFNENREKVRAVVLDMTMPNLNGREAQQAIRKIRGDTPVLLVSGFSENCASGGGVNSNTSFLQKPFKPDELSSKLQTLLGAPAKKRGPAELAEANR